MLALVCPQFLDEQYVEAKHQADHNESPPADNAA